MVVLNILKVALYILQRSHNNGIFQSI